MLTLFGPIVAQIATVSLSDRSEVRAVVADGTHYEAATRPNVGVGLTERRLQLQAGYGASITVTPLESSSRDALIFHSFSLGEAYSWKRTTLSVNESLGIGDQNFRVLATSGTPTTTSATGTNTGQSGAPPLPTPTPTPTPTPIPGGATSSPATPNNGQTSSVRALGETVRFATFSTNAALTHRLTPTVSLGGGLGYSLAGAIKSSAKEDFPVVRTWGGSVFASDALDPANTVSASVAAQYSESSNGNSAWTSGAGGSWSHQFDVQTSSAVGAGVGGSRSPRPDGFVAYTLYPSFFAALSHVRRLSPGSLSLSIGASSAPALDLITLNVDPRLAFNTSAVWQRDRVFASLGASTGYSVATQQQSGISGVSGGAGIGYQFGALLAMDCGLRVAWQAYHGETVVPVSYAAYLGASTGFGKQF